MKLTFKVTTATNPVVTKKNTVYLSASRWDDYSFETTFGVTLYDEAGLKTTIGQVKIGYIDQPTWAHHSAFARDF